MVDEVGDTKNTKRYRDKHHNGGQRRSVETAQPRSFRGRNRFLTQPCSNTRKPCKSFRFGQVFPPWHAVPRRYASRARSEGPERGSRLFLTGASRLLRTLQSKHKVALSL